MVRTVLRLVAARRTGIVEGVLTKAWMIVSSPRMTLPVVKARASRGRQWADGSVLLTEAPVMAMTRMMVGGSRGSVLVEALVFLMASTTDGAVSSLTSLTVPTRPEGCDVLSLVKWLSPMLGSGERAVKMFTSLVVVKSLVRGGGIRALPMVRERKNAILDRARVSVGMVSISRVVFLMESVGWSDKMVVTCVLNQRTGLGGRGVRKVSVVALVLIGISRGTRIGVTVVVAKVSVM